MSFSVNDTNKTNAHLGLGYISIEGHPISKCVFKSHFIPSDGKKDLEQINIGACEDLDGLIFRVTNENELLVIVTNSKAFFGLLSKKSIDEIRTQEIIASAGINKSTFYSHYKDKYDLLDSLAAEAAEILYPSLEAVFSVILKEGTVQKELDASYELFADTFQRNKDFFRIVMRNTSGSTLASRISDLIEKIWVDKSIADPGVVYYSYLINAITYIIVGTAEKWVKRDCIDPSDDLIRLAHDVGVGVQKALVRKQ